MPFQIIRNNIIDVQADAIVNSADPKVFIGLGVDKAIHEAAGPELFIERKRIGEIKTGEAFISSAFRLRAHYVIHTVGPIWQGGTHNEYKLLETTYLNSLELAFNNKCQSIAFPLISTGAFGFPKDQALNIAIASIKSFLTNHDMMVYLVVYDKESYVLSKDLMDSVSSFIDDNFIDEEEIVDSYYQETTFDAFELPRASKDRRSPSKKKERSLDELMAELEDTFSESLLKLIDRLGETDSTIYNKANIDRKHFSKIRKSDYHPSKKTAVALAVALELNLDETKDLIGRAGYAFANNNYFDVIIEYCIKNKIYDIYQINMILFEYDQQLLGAIV
ncbi:MAG: macro domain-containing protein [Acholeplasmataceae bacterium]|nr:macro domain-containing protein [Acholeplasmataceae bacterium]